jgi:hypothetical protein
VLSSIKTALTVTATKFWVLPKKLLERRPVDAHQCVGLTIGTLTIVIFSMHPVSLSKQLLGKLNDAWRLALVDSANPFCCERGFLYRVLITGDGAPVRSGGE